VKSQHRSNVTSTLGANHEQNAFGAKIGAKFFHVVFDQLYTNKVRAIIRELSTNAYDSPVEAGIPDAPFSWSLPTALKPVFTVRDYGVSMTHDEVMHLYTTVFETTKDDSDDFVGQLGLGSKSPFAYTDCFTVTAVLNGERRVYVASTGEDGVPTITHLDTQPTELPTGIEVSLPVEDRHFAEFRREAEEVARGFLVPPTVEGLELKYDPPLLQGDGWQVRPDSPNGIRQGCVIYPIAHYQVALDTGLHAGYGLIVDVPIGTVEVAANREALSLDDRTLTNVKEAFRGSADEVRKVVLDRIAASPTRLEAERELLRVAAFIRLGKVDYRDRPLTGTVTMQFDHPGTPTVLDHKEKRTTPAWLVEDLDSLVFLIDRSEWKLPRRRARFFQYRSGLGNRQRRMLHILPDPTKRQVATLIRRLGLRRDQIRFLTDLPDVEHTRRERDKDESPRLGGVYTRSGTSLVPLTSREDLPEKFLWVGVDRGSATMHDLGAFGSWHRSNIDAVYPTLLKALATDLPLLFVVPGMQRHLKLTDENNLVTLATQWVADNQEDLLARRLTRRAYDGVRSEAYGLQTEVIDAMLTDLAPAASKVREPALVLIRALPNKEVHATDVAASKRVEEITKRYPLLFGLATAKQLQEYINTINQSQEG